MQSISKPSASALGRGKPSDSAGGTRGAGRGVSLTSKSTGKPAQPGKSAKPGQTKRGPPPNEVRIMGGLWKRTPLPVPDQPGLRPTPGRVRETLFNWLGQDMTGLRVIDAFAGSGALGLEAASRGAKEVWLVEKDAQLVANLRLTVQKLGAHHVRIDKADAFTVLSQCAGQRWDGVLLDPPFLDGQNDELALRALTAAKAAIGPAGWVYLESPREWTAAELLPLGLAPHRQGKAGQVHYALLTVAELPSCPDAVG